MTIANERTRHAATVVPTRDSKLGLLIAWLLIGCASTRLDTSPSHPAAPSAPSEALPRMGTALEAEPKLQGDSDASAGGTPEMAHQHGDHQHASGPASAGGAGATPAEHAPGEATAQETSNRDASRKANASDTAGGGTPANEPQHGGHQHGASTAGAGSQAPAKKPDQPGSDGKAGNPTDAATIWTCSMHPEIRTSEPGNCPICGMKLQPEKPKGSSGGSSR